MVRNSKLLKRIDDLQQIIDSMHLRVEELQFANGNLLKLDEVEQKGGRIKAADAATPSGDMRNVIDNINRRIDELNLRNDVLQKRASLFSQYSSDLSLEQQTQEELSKPKVDLEKLFIAWKNYPGQDAKNAPNLRKQMQMLIHLFENPSLNSGDLFSKTGVNGVTGARYVATLKKFNLIEFTGARKKGHYVITDAGKKMVENTFDSNQPAIIAETIAVGETPATVSLDTADL
jgi:predicted transcriptional regulator